jgi:hypothetical protein
VAKQKKAKKIPYDWFEGKVPDPSGRGMTRTDRGGNRLIDVVHPETGYCVGVRSPLTFKAGERVIPHKSPSGGAGSDVRFAGNREVWVELTEEARKSGQAKVVRLTTDGDGILPVTRVRVDEVGTPDEITKAQIVRNQTDARNEREAAILAVLSGMGYDGPITRSVRSAVWSMIQAERNKYAYTDLPE